MGALGAVGCERWKNPSELAQAERLARPSRWGTPSVYTPANLTDAHWDRGSTDGEIFAVIANGAGPEFKMKGVKGRVSDTDIWNILNYVRSLGPKNAPR